MGKLASIAVAMAIVVAGCGSGAAQTVTSVETVTSSQATNGTIHLSSSVSGTACVMYAVGHNAQVAFNSRSLDVAPLCRNWIEKQGLAGEYWAVGSSPNAAQLISICALSYGVVNVNVEDDGDAFMGTQACAALAAAGWQS